MSSKNAIRSVLLLVSTATCLPLGASCNGVPNDLVISPPAETEVCAAWSSEFVSDTCLKAEIRDAYQPMLNGTVPSLGDLFRMGNALGHLFQNRGQTPDADRIFLESLRELIQTPEQLAAFMAADAALAEDAQLQELFESLIESSEFTYQSLLHDIPAIVNSQLTQYSNPIQKSTNHRDNCATHVMFVGCDTGLTSYNNLSISFGNFVKQVIPGATYQIWKIDNLPAVRHMMDCSSLIGSATHIEDCVDLFLHPEKNDAAFEVDVANSLVTATIRSGCLAVRGLEEQIRYGVRNSGHVIIIANRSGVELVGLAVSRLEPGIRAAVGIIQTGNLYPAITAPGLDPRYVAIVNNCDDVAVRWSFDRLGPILAISAAGIGLGGWPGLAIVLGGQLMNQAFGSGDCKHGQADPSMTTPWNSRSFVSAYLTGETGGAIATFMRTWDNELPCRQQWNPLTGHWIIPQANESLLHVELTDCDGVTAVNPPGIGLPFAGAWYTEPLPIPKTSLGDCSEPDYVFNPNIQVNGFYALHLVEGANPWEFTKSDIKTNPDEDPSSANARVKITALSLTRNPLLERWDYRLDWEHVENGDAQGCYAISTSEKLRIALNDSDPDSVLCTFERQVTSKCACDDANKSMNVKYQGVLIREKPTRP